MNKTAFLLCACGLAATGMADIDRSSISMSTATAREIGSTAGLRGTSTTVYSNTAEGTGYQAAPVSGINVNGELELLGTADYQSIATSNFELTEFQFIGGVNQVGGVVFFDFFDAGGSYIDSAGVQLSEAGNFLWTITLNTTFDIADGGFVQMYVDDENLAGAGSTAGGQWFLTDAGATIGDALAADAGTSFDYTVALSTVPAPGAAALLGLGGIAATRRRR